MKKSIAAVAIVTVIAAGCSPSAGPRERSGGLIGGLSGAAIGSQFGGGTEEGIAAAVLGGVLWSLIGSQIGRDLDELDRQRAQEAEYRALEYGRSGRPVVWRNDNTGHYGEVVAGPGYEVNSLDCRDYTHTIYIDGRPQVAKGTACRQLDGSWQIVS